METVICNNCGFAVGEDDFIMGQCPVCDASLVSEELDPEDSVRIEDLPRFGEYEFLSEGDEGYVPFELLNDNEDNGRPR